MNGRRDVCRVHTMRKILLFFMVVYLNLSSTQAVNVALCFFGLTRSLGLTVSNIRNSIIDSLLMADMNVSVYLHTYDLDAVTNPRSAENGAVMDWTAYKRLQPEDVQIDNVERVEEELIEPNLKLWLSHGDAWGETSDAHTTLRNFLKQLYSLSQVTKLWTAQTNAPDIVLYMRSDI